jgi:protein TonB
MSKLLSAAASVTLHAGAVGVLVACGVMAFVPAEVEVETRTTANISDIRDPRVIERVTFEPRPADVERMPLPEAPEPAFEQDRAPVPETEPEDPAPSKPEKPAPALDRPARATALRIPQTDPVGSTSAGNAETGAVETYHPPPEYPAAARRRGLEGETVVLMEIASDGTVSNATVAESSGWSMLDDAAIAAAKQWTYKPATRGGRPVASTQRVRFVFTLKK